MFLLVGGSYLVAGALLVGLPFLILGIGLTAWCVVMNVLKRQHPLPETAGGDGGDGAVGDGGSGDGGSGGGSGGS